MQRGTHSVGTDLLRAVKTNRIRKMSEDTELPSSLLKTFFLALLANVSLVIEIIAKTKDRISNP